MKEPYKIIDDLLTMIVMQRMGFNYAMNKNERFDMIQDKLLKDFSIWIKPALEYLKKVLNGNEKSKEITICMANDEWIKRGLSERENKEST